MTFPFRHFELFSFIDLRFSRFSISLVESFRKGTHLLVQPPSRCFFFARFTHRGIVRLPDWPAFESGVSKHPFLPGRLLVVSHFSAI